MIHESDLFWFGYENEYAYFVWNEDGKVKSTRVLKSKVDSVKTIDSLTCEVRKLKAYLSVENRVTMESINSILYKYYKYYWHVSNATPEQRMESKIAMNLKHELEKLFK